MTWHVVHLADVAPAPWKNGGGATRELVAWPNAQHWVWRMSVAEVAQSGPFSCFDGVQRWFAVLGGAGVALTHNGQRHALTVDSAPFCFDGGGPTDCELIDGATQDFNLMTRVVDDGAEMGLADEARASATMTRIRGSASIHFSASPSTTKIIAIYEASTRARARFNGENTLFGPHSLVWRIVAAHDDIQIDAEDALLIEIEVQPTRAIHVPLGAPTHTPNDSESAS